MGNSSGRRPQTTEEYLTPAAFYGLLPNPVTPYLRLRYKCIPFIVSASWKPTSMSLAASSGVLAVLTVKSSCVSLKSFWSSWT